MLESKPSNCPTNKLDSGTEAAGRPGKPERPFCSTAFRLYAINSGAEHRLFSCCYGVQTMTAESKPDTSDIPLLDLDLSDDATFSILDDLGIETTSVHPQETTSRIPPKHTYRGRFMVGKEKEFAATQETYIAMYGENIEEYGKHYHYTSNPHLTAIEQCRRYAQFKRERSSGEVKVFASACRDRWCPMCAGQKARFAKEQTQLFFESLKAPRFLTLTLRNDTGELKEQIEFLTMAFRTLRQRAFWKRNVVGGIWYLQVKRGKNSGCWHPHLHILLDGEYMEQTRLSQLWERVTYGSPIIDIQRIYNPEEAAKYVARYSARPANLSDLSLVDRIEVVTALHGKRMAGTFGTGKTVTLTPPKVEASGEWSDIGYYDTVVNRAKTMPEAKAILRAYFNDEALTTEAYEAYTGQPVVIREIPVHTDRPAQIYMDFYNR